jgi:hypothetical protein
MRSAVNHILPGTLREVEIFAYSENVNYNAKTCLTFAILSFLSMKKA